MTMQQFYSYCDKANGNTKENEYQLEWKHLTVNKGIITLAVLQLWQ